MNIKEQIRAVSYIGKPEDNTAMFLSAKAVKLLTYLEDVKNCLIFAEHGLAVPDHLLEKHHFEFSDNPQVAYYYFTKELEAEIKRRDAQRQYKTLDNGARIGENVKIGKDVEIGPYSIIHHDCEVGDDSYIGAYATIRKSNIGKQVHVSDYVSIGTDAFNLVNIEGNLLNMPTLGKVMVEDGVFLGNGSIISAGLAGITQILHHTQIDANCHIHHDCQILANTIICTGVKLGGFVTIGHDAFIGIGAQIKNRIKIGNRTTVGMGSVVIRNVEDNAIVYGNPAKTGDNSK